MQDKDNRTILSIAYGWFTPATSLGLGDIVIVLSWTLTNIDNTQQPEIYQSIFPIKLSKNSARQKRLLTGETLGILRSTNNNQVGDRASSFERTLSDLINWLIHENIDQNKLEHELIVMIAGPSLPKLFGRLCYDAIADMADVIVVTYEDKWLDTTVDIDTGSQIQRDSGWSLSSMAPPKEIGSISRTWVAKNGSDRLHIEVLANIYEQGIPTKNVELMQELIVILIKNSARISSGELIPKPLSECVTKTINTINSERTTFQLCSRLEHHKYDIVEFYKDPLVRKSMHQANTEQNSQQLGSKRKRKSVYNDEHQQATFNGSFTQIPEAKVASNDNIFEDRKLEELIKNAENKDSEGKHCMTQDLLQHMRRIARV